MSDGQMALPITNIDMPCLAPMFEEVSSKFEVDIFWEIL